jgi:hypothetical protein
MRRTTRRRRRRSPSTLHVHHHDNSTTMCRRCNKCFHILRVDRINKAWEVIHIATLNQQHARGNDDSFSKVKFTILLFYGLYDAETYFDWEMTIDQKFSSHLVLEQHHVRQTTSEFKDNIIIWWNKLSRLRLQPDTWDRLKDAMQERFVSPAYQHDLRKKLKCIDQGDKFVQD